MFSFIEYSQQLLVMNCICTFFGHPLEILYANIIFIRIPSVLSQMSVINFISLFSVSRIRLEACVEY